jgi:hypothetical protein
MAVDYDGFVFDYRLGYVRNTGDIEYLGFDVLGDDGGTRILTLGGYTTAEQAKENRAWVNKLYNRFKEDGKSVQIINGDTDGYTSAQEMMMLIRDGILFNPKVVICLSGFYNFAYKLGLVKKEEQDLKEHLQKYPFVNAKQLTYYNDITANMGIGYDKIYCGEENNTPPAEYWIQHTDIMHNICEAFNIQYKTFLQPCIFSGNYKASKNERVMLSREYALSQGDILKAKSAFMETYNHAETYIKQRDYIEDISHEFDNEKDSIYIDAVHLNDEALKSLVNRIYEVIYVYA